VIWLLYLAFICHLVACLQSTYTNISYYHLSFIVIIYANAHLPVKGIELTENLLLDKEEIVEEVDTTEEVKDESESGEICGLDSETSNQIRLAYDEFTTNVDELTDMLDGTLEGFSDDLRSLISLTQNIDDSLDTADIFFYILITISVVIICIVAAMLAAVFFAIKGWENTFTRIIKGALLWPFFIFFLLLSWIFATLFLVFSLAGADFCVDPDGYVQVLLEQSEDMFEGLIFGFIVYYVSGCQVEPAGVAEIRELSDVAQTVVESAHGLFYLTLNTSPVRPSMG